VDTFQAEVSLEIEAIALKLKALDTDVAEIDKIIADFCRELGIETPF
jgi:type I restriction enzyme M protein